MNKCEEINCIYNEDDDRCRDCESCLWLQELWGENGELKIEDK